MSQPPGAANYTVTRTSGAWTGGKWVANAPSTFDVIGALQPLTPRQVEALPEGARTRASWRLFCYADQAELTVTPIGTTPQRTSDRVAAGGRNYVVHAVEDHTNHTSGIPHRAYTLLEVGDDE